MNIHMPKIENYTMDGLMNMEIPPVEWTVDKILPSQGITMIAGDKNAFKTFITYNLAVCISLGKPFLGYFNTKKKNVLYLDSECGKRVMKRRSKQILEGLGISEEELEGNLHIIPKQPLKVNQQEHIVWLNKYVKDNNIEVVVFDTFRRFHDLKENSSDDANRLFTTVLQPLNEKYGCDIILVSHTKKPSKDDSSYALRHKIRGSSAFVNFADSVFLMERKEKSYIVEIKNVDNRHGEEIPPISVNLSFSGEDDSEVRILTVDREEMLVRTENESTSIILGRLMKEEEGFIFETGHAKKWIQEKTGEEPNDNTVDRILKKLQENKSIDKVGRGVWKRIVVDKEDWFN